MRKLLPVLLLGWFLQGSAKAQCDTSFFVTINGATAHFQAADSSLTTHHQWKFGDGTQGWGHSVSHTYSTPGTYVVKYIVADTVNNCRDSAQRTISISFTTSCSASFYAKKDSLNPTKYYFYSTSTVGGGSINAYNWTINGDTVSSAWTFSHLLNPGFNLVCLTIKTTTGCTSSTCDSIYVDTTGNCNWSASFTYTYNPGNPAQVSFSPAPVIPGLSYSWNFGDGFVSNIQSPTHTYSNPGTYSVFLAVTDSAAGCFDTARRFVTITPNTDTCKASFIAKQDSIFPNKYHFNSTSTAGGGSIQSYKWTVNGDSVSSASAFSHLLNPGFNLVCLLIKTTTGCTSSKCDSIYVDTTVNCNLLSASFTYTVNPSQPNQLTFTATSNATIVSWYWSILACDSGSAPLPDSIFYNTANPVHTFANPGCYQVCLRVYTNTGCIKYYCDTVMVNSSAGAKLIASFPNPVHGANVHVRLNLEQAAKVKLTVFNSNGNVVYTNERPYSAGQNTISIPVNNLQRGLYYIDIQYGNNRKRSVFQKL